MLVVKKKNNRNDLNDFENLMILSENQLQVLNKENDIFF